MTTITIPREIWDAMLQALSDIKYGLEGSRIWGGMNWTYHPMHPVKYLPLRDKAEQALAAANAVQQATEPLSQRPIESFIASQESLTPEMQQVLNSVPYSSTEAPKGTGGQQP